MIAFKNNYFRIDSKSSTYLFKLNKIGNLEHLYYGKTLDHSNQYSFLEEQELYGAGVETNKNGYRIYNNCASFEYSTKKRGDYREASIILEFDNGDQESDFKYKSHKILKNYHYPALATSYDKSETLIITLVDEYRNVEVNLYYSIFKDSDVIVCSASVKNNSNKPLMIKRLMSSQLDILDTHNYKVVSFNGAWAKERMKEECPLGMGNTIISSNLGFSGHERNPFVILKENNTSLENGNAYGFNLIYTGNHKTSFERTSYHKIRILNGINDYDFSWTLPSKEEFYAPETTICYSSNGLNELTHSYHKFILNHIIPQEFNNKARPILLNTWEGCLFDFDENKILKQAKKAKEVGVELLVVDDGWFGKRNNDQTSLGDWFTNLDKIPSGMDGLSKKIHAMGLKFGLWFEPEMISPKSQLFTKHPDWAISHPGYEPLLSRNQLVLDLTNPKVVDYLSDLLIEFISDAKLDYIKWDCNRNIADYYSKKLKNQGEFLHRYILGLYQLLTNIRKRFPTLLIESCSGGGNRFDLGMLCFTPQIWCSDNTDAFDRMKIQEGTLYGYPQSCIGAHVSSTLSHQTFRVATLDNKFNVACLGAFGYELNLCSLSQEELDVIKEQIRWYKKNRNLLQFGQYTLNSSIFDDSHQIFTIVNNKKTESVLFLGNKIFEIYTKPTVVKNKDLDFDSTYQVETRLQHQNKILNQGKYCEQNAWTISGKNFANCGIRLPYEWNSGNGNQRRVMEDFGTRIYKITKTK